MSAHHQQLLDQLTAVSTALEQFDELGITVLSIHIGEQPRPVIEVQYSRACARLESGLYMAITRDRQRLHERAAQFCGCRVRWQQRIA